MVNLRRLQKNLLAISSVVLLVFSEAAAKEVKVGMGNFEPYYIADGKTGIFTDILIAVFRYLPDYEPNFLFGFSNQRLWREFEKGNLDAVSNLYDSVKLDGCRSEPIFRYQNVAVTKRNDSLKIRALSDLAGKSIVSFQGAKRVFGSRFTKLLNKGFYTEVSKPELQAKMLMRDRVDVSIGDKFIFLQSIKKFNGGSAGLRDIEIHTIFPPTFTRFGMHDRKLCAQFNEAFIKVQKSGEYEKIYKSYLKRLE